jgi:hypothetical protein
MRLMRGQGKCGDYHGARTLGCGGRGGGGWVGGGWWRTHKIETQTQHGKPQTYQGRLLGTYIHHTIPGGKAGVYSHTTRVMKNREGGRREHMERGKACVTMLGRSPGTFPPTHTHTHKKKPLSKCGTASTCWGSGGRVHAVQRTRGGPPLPHKQTHTRQQQQHRSQRPWLPSHWHYPGSPCSSSRFGSCRVST